jgi:hypothetical protein
LDQRTVTQCRGFEPKERRQISRNGLLHDGGGNECFIGDQCAQLARRKKASGIVVAVEVEEPPAMIVGIATGDAIAICAKAKASLTKIMEITRHKDSAVLINSYIRPIALFEDHAAQGLL